VESTRSSLPAPAAWWTVYVKGGSIDWPPGLEHAEQEHADGNELGVPPQPGDRARREQGGRDHPEQREPVGLTKVAQHGQAGQLDAPLIGAFLDHLERDRGASARTRNARLAAIRSLFRFAALRHPEHAALIQRVLAIPGKRHDRTDVCFLTREEIEALLVAPDRSRLTLRIRRSFRRRSRSA
jgi:hypothetical protein